ncbi:HAD-like domain-containing protein [Lipomyces tetrasporus]|uniref:HAD-like domain-containing protein n=1 Tax=Lipomyces tetrasporus TaxID=54092 RepID=A0AAD7QTH9_9ASCO|nr:HAD-like domain-containing protein [Lipomyces tetrasporus]KAJ8101085.1 HAD-like domain-containing protein [Lipomyces tetrasporus]
MTVTQDYPISIPTHAILFDLDGTLVDSTDAIVAYWTRFGNQHNIPPERILATSHGKRTVDTLLEHTPHLVSDTIAHELESDLPKEFGDKARTIRGAFDFLQRVDTLYSCDDDDSDGRRRRWWGIVTSGSYSLASQWLDMFGMPIPDVFITAEKVDKGKPNPEGYLLGRKLLSADQSAGRKAVVFEDAPAGIRAGKAAGAVVVGIVSTHTKDEVIAAGADFVVADLLAVDVVRVEDSDEFIVRVLQEA